MTRRLGHLLLLTSLVLQATANTPDDSTKLKSPLQDPEPIQFVENVLEEPESQDYCNPTGQIKDTCCDYRSVEEIQRDIFDKVQSILNLWRECPFWADDGLCMNRDCSVETTDESSLPEEWRQPALSAVQISPKGSLFQPFKTCQYKDQDFCLIEDESDSGNQVYVDLTDNPERFTGYAGPSSARVWKAIYEENCFNIVDKMTEGCETCNNIMHPGQKPDQGRSSNPLKAAQSIASATSEQFVHVPDDKEKLDQLLSDLAEDPDGGRDDGEEVCLEKRVYYRLVSGLHSSISIHICDEYFNQITGKWEPNLDCFVNRIGSHPERLQNIYFTYALVMRAVTKLGTFFEDYEFCTGENKDDMTTKAEVLDLINSARACPATFDESTMFQGADARSLKIEFRDHFRNVSRIMDCVGCEKCRLWGKIQTTGLGTALKVLFSYGENNLNPKWNPNLLQRSEIVALFNTLNRLSESLQAIQKFRKLYRERTHQQVVSKECEPFCTCFY
ncbi:endoplasmic reticulum Oxidoreductin 1-domain-containing protein [Fennellomyces sp. T-0311]|nr:endoplasmic reticulum Oxidoreductin 1-domain-containing protein [Fennellomyces sp. T-0311]